MTTTTAANNTNPTTQRLRDRAALGCLAALAALLINRRLPG